MYLFKMDEYEHKEVENFDYKGFKVLLFEQKKRYFAVCKHPAVVTKPFKRLEQAKKQAMREIDQDT